MTITTDYMMTKNNAAYSAKNDASSVGGDIAVEFAAILSEARATVRETLEENDEQRRELKAVQAERQPSETLTRIMPDGSIRVTEYEDGQIVTVSKYRPHMQTVIDMSAPLPRNIDGTTDLSAAPTKLEPSKGVFNLMMPSGF